MNYKKTKASPTTITRDLINFEKGTNNIYETLVIIAKRSNQIAQDIKRELNQKLDEFASYTDNLEEVFENREQIEVSKYYEKLPKPTLIAIQEFIDDEIYYREPEEKINKVEVE